MLNEATEKIKKKENLSRQEMESVFIEIMKGLSKTEDIAAFLAALREKKETVEEITGAALIMRKFAEKISPKKKGILDTCGTGGDSCHTFNISTISAFVASGGGATVAKHGNRRVSSKCGSADLLEALGVNINIPKELIEKCIDDIGIGFLFAPKLHLAMKYAAPARKLLKTRSIFNILGPLTNPAGATRQLLGVYEENLAESLANVLKNLGSERAMVVAGKDGMDEITTTDETFVAELKDGEVKTYTIAPEDFGLKRAKKESLLGGDASLNSEIALEILEGKNKDKEGIIRKNKEKEGKIRKNKGKEGERRDIVLLNAGAGIYVAGLARDIKEGVEKAIESIDSGRAMEKLEKLKELTKA